MVSRRRRGAANHQTILGNSTRYSLGNLNPTSLKLTSIVVIVGAAIVSNRVACWNLVILHQRVDNPLKTFFALNHFDEEASLKDLVVLFYV